MCRTDIQKNLEKLAFQKTIPFCYSCYKEAPSGRCNECHSDDLMRLLPGSGCEFGVEWVIKEILNEYLNEVDSEEIFEQSIDDCYGETTQVGFMKFSTANLMKEMDPISWRIARDEYIDSLEEDEQVLSFDGGANHYWTHDLQSFIDEQLH